MIAASRSARCGGSSASSMEITVASSSSTNLGQLVAGVGGLLSFTGSLTSANGANMTFELGGATPATIGRIAVSGALALAGSLSVALVGGYTPAIGQTFDVMTFGSVTGSLANVIDLNPTDGIGYVANMGASKLTLTAIP